VVEGKSNRKIADEPVAIQKLASLGYQVSEITNTKLKGLTDLERLIGKKQFNEVLGELIVKPAGAPTLVPVSDKRPAITSAQMDFKEEM